MRDTIAVPSQMRRNVRGLPDRRAVQLQALHESAHDRKMLRQIGEFSFRYEQKKRKGIFLSILLIVFSAMCVILFVLDINTIAFFSIGALLILFQLFYCAYELSEEGARVQRAYHTYLAGISPQMLAHLRYSARLSDWTKYEIDKFIDSTY